MLKLNFTAASDRGLVRGNNEDSAYAGPYLLALADGMGGHAAGEVASQLMITHLMGLDKNPGDNDMLAPYPPKQTGPFLSTSSSTRKPTAWAPP